MITRKEVIEKISNIPELSYDPDTGLVKYQGWSIPLEDLYRKYLKENGMSFKCICDVHWECMSLIECTECGTVIKEYYDEWYEPNFRCPVCTDYKTGYEFYTKEEIEASEELQAVINMYKGLNDTLKEQDERIQKRNGLEDYQLLKPRQIKIGNNVYRFSLLIDSITNKNKLQGLKLEISKFEKNDSLLELRKKKIIPLSKEAYVFYKHILPEIENNSDLDFLSSLKGKSLTETMEEKARKRVKNK